MGWRESLLLGEGEKHIVSYPDQPTVNNLGRGRRCYYLLDYIYYAESKKDKNMFFIMLWH